MSYYTTEQMDGYYRIGSQEGTFCYVLAGSERVMLIDTGYGFSDLRSAVREITDRPLIILNTHGHCDHTGGNCQFDEVCYIHRDDIPLCRDHNTREMREASALRGMHSLNYETGEEFNALPENFQIEDYAAGGYGHLEAIAEGTVFDLGGITAEILKTPGHTAGGLSVWYREKNLVFIGDATGIFVWLYLPESTNKESYIEMLDRLYALNAEGYIGAHNANVIHREELLLYKEAALEADYASGEDFQSFLAAERQPRVCTLPGMTMQDMFQPGFASVVIGKDWGLK